MSQRSRLRARYDNFIGGKWQTPAKGRYFVDSSPIDGMKLCDVARSDAEDVERALDAAHAAKDAWGRTAPAERSRMLNKIADRIEENLALLAYAETQTAANTKIVGTVGYCMSGRYAVNAATHFADRVKAAASVYGVQLATDQPDSPHLAADKTRAELYFACAETDVYAPQEVIDKVSAGMKGTKNEVEIYPGTHHGFAFPKRPVYDRDAAERHWERLLALYKRNLV